MFSDDNIDRFMDMFINFVAMVSTGSLIIMAVVGLLLLAKIAIDKWC
jgi:hypothetical protein